MPVAPGSCRHTWATCSARDARAPLPGRGSPVSVSHASAHASGTPAAVSIERASERSSAAAACSAARWLLWSMRALPSSASTNPRTVRSCSARAAARYTSRSGFADRSHAVPIRRATSRRCCVVSVKRSVPDSVRNPRRTRARIASSTLAGPDICAHSTRPGGSSGTVVRCREEPLRSRPACCGCEPESVDVDSGHRAAAPQVGECVHAGNVALAREVVHRDRWDG
jgi:hypothetical protein